MAEIIVAVAIDPRTGEEYDQCFAWETGQTMAQEGYIVRAVAADGFMGVEDAQRLYDYERRLFIDCWGQDHPFSE